MTTRSTDPLTRRPLVALEIVASGPDPRRHRVIEASGIDTVTGHRVDVIWPLSVEEYQCADRDQLRAMSYDLRFGGPETGDAESRERVESQVLALAQLVAGATIGSSDPTRVAAFVLRLFDKFGARARWHHRFMDLSALTVGAHHLDATALPTLEMSATLWRVPESGCEESAAGKATLAADCFRRFRASDTGGHHAKRA